MIDATPCSFGAELELADLQRSRQLPRGCGWDEEDFSMVNSTGIAVDPTGQLHDRGGEVKTRPTATVGEQLTVFDEVVRLFPEAQVNYRCNLHLHAQIPGLADDLEALCSLQQWVHRVMPVVLPIIEPIPRPTAEDYPDPAALDGAMWRFHRRRRSHQTLLSATRLQRQLQADTLEQFFRLEVPADARGRPMWHAQRRCCVNLRQLLQTGTIEFRHFPGTLSTSAFHAAFQWVRVFFSCWAQNDLDLLTAMAHNLAPMLPSFLPYSHDLEQTYRLTTHDGTVPADQLRRNIAAAHLL